MGTFNKHVLLQGDPAIIPAIANEIEREFVGEGFEVKKQSLFSGGVDISITKGGIFKAVLGMKTALKITMTPQGNSIIFDANVGIWGQQTIPTIISMLFFWPVLITQIWGMVNQAKMDDKALEIAYRVINTNGNQYQQSSMSQAMSSGSVKYCNNCGAKIENPNAKFCTNCGNPL